MSSLSVIFLNKTELICLHTVKWFQVILYNSDSSIWLIDETQTGTITLGQSGPGSNGTEGVLHIRQSSRTGASLSDGVWYHTQDTRSFSQNKLVYCCGTDKYVNLTNIYEKEGVMWHRLGKDDNGERIRLKMQSLILANDTRRTLYKSMLCQKCRLGCLIVRGNSEPRGSGTSPDVLGRS